MFLIVVKIRNYIFVLLIVIFFSSCFENEPSNIQKNVDKIESLSYNPLPYKLMNWKQKAIDYDEIVFEKKTAGKFQLSTIDSNGNLSMLAYVGDYRSFNGGQEAINVFAALLSGTLVGKNNEKYFGKLEGFYNKKYKIFTNNIGGKGGESFWYDIFPNILYAKISLRNENNRKMENRFRDISDSWREVGEWLILKQDLNYTSYDFEKKKGVVLKWIEPDAAIGIAYLQLLAYEHFKDEKYLNTSKNLMLLIEKYPGNPFYEILSSYGPYTAAVLNAKYGMNLNVEKYFNWILNGDSDVRNGWGVMQGRWKDYDVSGLVGNVSDNGGYAFTMNTFALAEAISAIPKYDARYANAVGKWLYNIIINARLFYRDGISKNNQNTTEWNEDVNFAIPYEGLRFEEFGKIPIATGDAKKYKWAMTDYSLYSGSYVGMIANIYEPTDNKAVMRFNLNANDYLSKNEFPVYLYFNASNDSQQTIIKIIGKNNIYDVSSKKFLAKNITKDFTINIPSKTGIVIAIIPSDKKIKEYENNIYANNEFVASSPNIALNIKNFNSEKAISEKLNIQIEATSKNKIAGIKIELDDDILYEGKNITNYIFDSSKIKNGIHNFKFVALDKIGKKDLVERKAFIYNIGAVGSIISLERNLDNFQSESISLMPGKSKIVDKKLLITENNPSGGWGGIKINIPKFNFNKKPSLMINISSATKLWGMKILRKTDKKNKWGFYIQGDTSRVGMMNIDIIKALKTYNPNEVFEGEQDIELWIFAVGDENANVIIKDLDLFYMK